MAKYTVPGAIMTEGPKYDRSDCCSIRHGVFMGFPASTPPPRIESVLLFSFWFSGFLGRFVYTSSFIIQSCNIILGLNLFCVHCILPFLLQKFKTNRNKNVQIQWEITRNPNPDFFSRYVPSI